MNTDAMSVFREVWLVDTEFHAPPGEQPKPLCLVAREFRTGRTIRLWHDDLMGLRAPPCPTGPSSLFVSYFASAEVGVHLALGWPVPVRILDLFTEFRCLTNGLATPHGRGQPGALAWHGLDPGDTDLKRAMRDLAVRGGPFTPEERAELLSYCESDVDGLSRLLPAMLPRIDLPRALLRGRYMSAVARIERAGVPIDVATHDRLHRNADALRERIVRDRDVHGVYSGQSFVTARFADYLRRHDLPWPFLDTGNLDLDEGAFETMGDMYPEVVPIAELRDLLAKMRLCPSLTIGSDGRNRALLSPFASRTGRNQPSGSKFVFGPASWLRGLVRPEPGRFVCQLDWSRQEYYLGAVLSGDRTMMEAYESGDPYLEFGKRVGLIPPWGTDETHAEERERCKKCILGTQYGMRELSLARAIKQSPAMRGSC